MKTCRKGLHQYDGARCGECFRAARRARYAKNPKRVRERVRARYAANAEKVRARNGALRRANAERVRTRKREWYAANAEKVRARNRKWREENPEKHRAATRAWHVANPEKTREWRAAHPGYLAAWRAANPEIDRAIRHRRRARKLGGAVEPITAAHLKLLLAAQDERCRYCRNPLGKDKHLDHRQPLARGGAHAPSNVCWACPTCNLRKHTLTEAEFVATLGLAA